MGLHKKPSGEVVEYSVADGLNQSFIDLEALLAKKERLVVCIGGSSSSGKTSIVTKAIEDRYADDTLVLSMDDYYLDEAGVVAKFGYVNWNLPEAIDFESLNRDIAALLRGESIARPVYSKVTNSRTGSVECKPRKIIAVEGMFGLHEEVRHLGDYKIFVETDLQGRIIRRIVRDAAEFGRQPHPTLRYLLQAGEPMYSKNIAETKVCADLVIKNEFNPVLETQKLLSTERSIVCREIKDLLALPMLNQHEYQEFDFHPLDKVLDEQTEAVSVSKVGDNLEFMYLGPINMGALNERRQLSFPIDEETFALMQSTYGHIHRTHQKIRRVLRSGDIDLLIETSDPNEGFEIRVKGKYEVNEVLSLLKLIGANPLD